MIKCLTCYIDMVILTKYKKLKRKVYSMSFLTYLIIKLLAIKTSELIFNAINK